MKNIDSDPTSDQKQESYCPVHPHDFSLLLQRVMQPYLEHILQLKTTMEHVLELLESKVPPADALMASRAVLDYLGISERTFQRCKVKGYIQAVDEQVKDKYYRHRDVVELYRIYHKRLPSRLP
ncbi:hypothetical protein [Sphingobacterium sp. SYP-B4668]|uniref:hypothetical protein n=1 Tax=Sphingobacterium sp. SYP-B4668 TaxID=2996035 RepID=UPI0022DD040A|nr:hypothetical protein [Sphingobacterium sp. SYP-B4668]